MAWCSQDQCQGWRPDLLVNRRRAGYRLGREWYCSRPCWEQATRERLTGKPVESWPSRGLRIGDLLLSQHAVTAAALRLALAEQAITHLPLGRQLEAMGLVSSGDVLRALSTQAGVGYLASIDTTQVVEVSRPVSSAILRELGLIPLEIDPEGQRLTVASCAPVPWLALRAIDEVTGWTFEPLLVSDDDWRTLTTRTAQRDQVQAIPVGSLEEAVTQTADLAADRHSRDINVARIDPYILVRLEGRDRDENTLFHLENSMQEEPCQAVST